VIRAPRRGDIPAPPFSLDGIYKLLQHFMPILGMKYTMTS
jgi:hypothetical protein